MLFRSEQGTLTIHAVSSEAREPGKEAGEYLLQEIRRGETTRTVTLPTGLEPEQAEATFENGILTLRIPRAESVKPRQIRINPRAQVTGETTRPTGTTADPDAEHATVGAGSAH